jgi:selenide,water dikinase
MQASSSSGAHSILRDVVLIGGGHSHAIVLKRFAMRPEPGVRLTVICTDADTPYSGMLPGYVAGHYEHDDVHIDLPRLAQAARARFIRGEVIGLAREQQKVVIKGRPPLAYDLVSINIGSAPAVQATPGALDHTVAVKPIARFREAWLDLLASVETLSGPLRIAVVGAGAGGVELLLAMQHRLRSVVQARGGDPHWLSFHLFSSSATILPTHNPQVRHRFEHVLRERGVQIHVRQAVRQVDPGHLTTESGASYGFERVFWVTQAAPAAWLRQTGLALDEGGFVAVNETLQSINDPKVFAAGDVAGLKNARVEKAGVFAVRQGRPLEENLRRALKGQPLEQYRPQRHWLALISTGDQYAVASRGSLSAAGAWVWRWKDAIDRRFMRQFSELKVGMMQAGPSVDPTATLKLEADEARQAISALAMRCGGCGAKVGANVLSRALGALEPIEPPDVLIGLKAPDDAAVVRVPAGKAMVHTVDFFRSFIDDPYRFGRIAANHALGDIFAMGAQAQSATAIATVPPGLESKTEELLFQMMSGAVEVLNAAGCALVGGHTGEGQELALGFAINGLIDEDLQRVMRKGAMQPGDVLILTKPMGTGTLFAAHPQGRAKGRWIEAALDQMQVSNRQAAQCLREYGVTACTDLTGFGLLGHLVEMTKPSGVDARLTLSRLPLLDGALECVQAGIVSSLQPANLRLRRALRNHEAFLQHPRLPLIFDPQTAGGLLASIPEASAQACLAALHALGYPHATVIGQIEAQGDALEPIVLEN